MLMKRSSKTATVDNNKNYRHKELYLPVHMAGSKITLCVHSWETNDLYAVSL